MVGVPQHVTDHQQKSKETGKDTLYACQSPETWFRQVVELIVWKGEL